MEFSPRAAELTTPLENSCKSKITNFYTNLVVKWLSLFIFLRRITFFYNLKKKKNKTIQNEEKKEFLNKFSDFLCNDLIRRGNLIHISHIRKNILRPLSPHLPIYKPQLTSTFPISHRISGAFLATIVLFFYLLCLKIGFICFTYHNFYQFLFYSSKLILISVEITTLALSYHLYNGVRHLLTDFSGFFFLKIGRKRLK